MHQSIKRPELPHFGKISQTLMSYKQYIYWLEYVY
jgi:hypothetical protein